MNGLEDASEAFAHEAVTVAGVAIGLTAATYAPAGAPGAVRAVLTLEAGQVRYRYDGTDPTATTGHLLEIGDVLMLEGAGNIGRFRAIRTGVSGTLRVTFERA